MVRHPAQQQVITRGRGIRRVAYLVATAGASISLWCCGSNEVVPAAGASTEDGGVEVDVSGDAGGEREEIEGGPSAACPLAGASSVAGTVDSPEIGEASGIVASSVNQNAFWVHNDSGDTARAFAIDGTGKLLTTLTFDSAKPRDIEDIAIEDDPAGKSFLYLGDIGDNDAVRPNLTIHRVEEPKLGGGAALSITSETMTVVYADGAHNAETLLFDPITKDLLIATKKPGGPSDIHRVGPFVAGTTAKTVKVASVDVNLATGGEISRDGRLVAIRNYGTSVFVWSRAPGESVADALARTPCTLPVAAEVQGEAFAFLVGSKGYMTLSEGASPALHLTLLR